MGRFRDTRQVRFHKVIDALLDGADGQLPGVGRHGQAADDGDCRLAGRADMDRVRDPARRLHRRRRADDRVRSARAGLRQRRARPRRARSIDLVYRRVLVNDILAKPAECRALVDACAARAVCMANSFRCKLAHKKAFFAVLTDPAHASLFSAERARGDPRARSVDARRSTTSRRDKDDWRGELLELTRAWREHLVLKPNDEYGGKGVNLGWEMTEGEWETRDRRRRSTTRTARGSCRSGSRCGARCSRSSMRTAASA